MDEGRNDKPLIPKKYQNDIIKILRDRLAGNIFILPCHLFVRQQEQKGVLGFHGFKYLLFSNRLSNIQYCSVNRKCNFFCNKFQGLGKVEII
jgi:hypothetical protein